MSDYHRGVTIETGSSLIGPPRGWKACQRCGRRLAPLPLTLCRDCYVRVHSGSDGRHADHSAVIWDNAANRQEAARAMKYASNEERAKAYGLAWPLRQHLATSTIDVDLELRDAPSLITLQHLAATAEARVAHDYAIIRRDFAKYPGEMTTEDFEMFVMFAFEADIAELQRSQEIIEWELQRRKDAADNPPDGYLPCIDCRNDIAPWPLERCRTCHVRHGDDPWDLWFWQNKIIQRNFPPGVE